VSLSTPSKIQRLQRSLYAKAKQEPVCRFHFLYDKVYQENLLAHAWALSRKRRSMGPNRGRFARHWRRASC